MMCCNTTEANGLGGGLALLETPKRWSKGVGSVIAVRKDLKPLHAHHVEVLLKFIQASKRWTTSEIFHASLFPTLSLAVQVQFGQRTNTATKGETLAQFTAIDFKEFYLEEKSYWKNVEDCAYLLELPSPWTDDQGRRLEPAKISNGTSEDSTPSPEPTWKSSQRNQIRQAYGRMTFNEKLRSGQSWREFHLLMVIAELMKPNTGDMRTGRNHYVDQIVRQQFVDSTWMLALIGMEKQSMHTELKSAA